MAVDSVVDLTVDLTGDDDSDVVFAPNIPVFEETERRRTLESVMRALYIRHVLREVPICDNVMTPLTDKEIADIDDALDKKKDPGEVLGKRNAVDLTRKDVMTMGEGQRLNDEVLNFSLDVLLSKTKGDADGQNRFHIFNTFFYEKLTEEGGLESVKRWTRENKLKYDILTCEKIFVPVHVGCRKLGHWFLVVVNLREMTVNVWDSIGGTNEKEAKNIHQWIVEEYREKKNRKVEFRVRRAENIPRQNNLVDCGVFMYQYVERTVMGCPLNFSHQDIPHLRRRMIANALKEKPITDN